MNIQKEVKVINFKITLDDLTEVNLTWDELRRLRDAIEVVFPDHVRLQTKPNSCDETEEMNRLLYTVDKGALAERMGMEAKYPNGWTPEHTDYALSDMYWMPDPPDFDRED